MKITLIITLIFISLFSFSKQNPADAVAIMTCFTNEFLSKSSKLVSDFIEKILSPVDLITQIIKDIHATARDTTLCFRRDIAKFPELVNRLTTIGKVGIIMLNKSTCERDIGITLVIIDLYIPKFKHLIEKDKLEPSELNNAILNSVAAVISTGISYVDCKKEIELLIEIWNPQNTAVSTIDDSDCFVGHLIVESIALILKDKFLQQDQFLYALIKIALEIHSSVIQCERAKVINGKSNLSIFGKIGWSIIDKGVQCERSLGTVLILIDKLIQMEDWKNILAGLSISGHIINAGINCNVELGVILEILDIGKYE